MQLPEDAIFEDERADVIFMEIFNPDDGFYAYGRDEPRLTKALGELVALGYSEEDARHYINENLADCDPV